MLPRKADGRREENEGRKTVQSRKQSYAQRKEITSFFISNIPEGTNGYDLKETFRGFGRISDVYIPGRKDKGGSYFGFVKFEGVKNAHDMEKELQGIRCGHCILKVNISRHGKQDQIRTSRVVEREKVTHTVILQRRQYHQKPRRLNQVGRTYAEAAGARRRDPPPPPSSNIGIHKVQLKPAPAMDMWNDCAVIGEAINLQILIELPKLIKADCCYHRDIYYGGGMRVVLRFNFPTEAKYFIKGEHNWNR
ncbi:hypothetical protein LXL04_027463 [Taraxacum kok-saghyz]